MNKQVKFTKEQFEYLKEILGEQCIGIRWSSYDGKDVEIQALNPYKQTIDKLCVNKDSSGCIVNKKFYTEEIRYERQQSKERLERFNKS